jgi:ATP-dependent exoDNAse (exonuclease V) beta subunit
LIQFNHIKLPELQFDLKSETTEKGRKYILPDGRKYDSVTTILSHNKDKTFLEEWRNRIGFEEANKIVKKSSDRGTKLHLVCEKYLLNELTDMKIRIMMPDIKDFFSQLRPHIDKNIGNIYGLEQALYSDRFQMAGRTDCIAEWNGKISIVDYKNSIKEKNEAWIQDYFIQCTAYATMFTEITNLPIEQIVVLIANEEGTPQVFVRQRSDYFDKFSKVVDDYHKSKLSVIQYG